MKARKIAQDELNKSLAEQATQLATDELALRDLEERIKSGAKYEEVFDDAMQGASVSAKEHAIATKGAAGSTDVFVEKQKQAQTQLQATAKASKAAKIGMKALATVGSTIASALIAKGIGLAASALDKYINRAKYAKEAMQEAQEAINSSQEDLKALSETLSKNKDRFLELSQGVDKFSNNKFLSDEDYAEFLSISQEIADVAPDLVAGYDEQGNALLRLGENAKETGEILDDVLEIGKTNANKTLVDNLPDVVKGINYSVKEAKQEINDLEAKLEHIHSNTSSSGMDILESLKKDAGLVFDGDNYNKYGKKMEKALANAGIDYTINSDINSKTIMLEGKFYAESLEKAQKYFDEQVEMQQKGYSAEELGLKNSIKEKERLINSYYSQINTNLQAWTKENYQYQSLNSTNQTFIDRLIPSLDWNKIIEESGLDSFSSYDYQNYIAEKLITPLSTAPDKYREDINEAISKLLKFKDGDLEIVSFGEQVQKEFDKNNIEIDITPIFSDEKEAYEKLQNSLKDIAGGSKNELSYLKDFTNGFTKEEANRWEQVTLGAKTATEAIVRYQSTLQTDYSSSVEKLDTSISSLTENQELLNAALAEQAENGTISEETIASLKEKYSDLSKVLEITTNGVIINKDKLAELNAEEKKSIDKNLISTREKLVEQYNANSLAIAGYKMKLEDTGSIANHYKAQLEAMLSVKEADQAKTEEQIAQLDLLGVEYDQLTSKTNKFLKSLSTADEGNIYDSVHSALEQVKEVYDEGDYGKDEFRSFVDYMNFEDLSTAPIEEVKDKYEDAMETAERYFTETNKGLKNFLTDTKKIGMATKDANGNWELNIESVDDLAKKLGISSDAAQDILNKFKDKGWEINFTTTTDGLVDVETKLDKLEKKREKLEKKRAKLELDDKSTEEIDKEIDAVQKGIDGINEQIELSIKTDEAKVEILEIQSQINSLSDTSVNAYVNKEQIEELRKQQKELAEKYNIDLDAVLKVDTTKADKNVEETKEKSKEDTTFEVDAHTKAATDKIDEIFNKTYYLNVGVKNVTLENAKKKITNFLSGVTKKDDESEEGSSKANGTAITGRAYANGKRGKIAAGYSAKSLVGELGPEMRVRDGKYEVLGENGPEFTDVRPDDIIFNAKQTEEILKKGKVNARGNAYNTGVSGGGKSLDEEDDGKNNGKSNNKKKKSNSSSTDTTKFQEAIDWCAQTIGKLTSVIDKINAKLSLTNSSLKTQIKNYKELLNKQQSLIKGYSKSETVYKKEYNKALKKLSKSDKKKVKDGTYRIEQFSGKAKSGSTSKAEKRYNNIQKALEARDTYLEAQTNTINAKQDFQEYAESLASVRWDKATEQVEKLNNQISVLDTRMSNVSGYKAKNKVLQEQLDLQKKILTKQENAYANTQSDANSVYKKISSKYKKNKNSDGTIKTKGVTNQTQLKYIKEYNAYVKELAKDEIELAQAQEDYTAAVQEASVARAEYIKTDYDNKISLIDAKANQLDSQISLAEAKGQVASVEFYKQLQNNSNQRKTELEAEKKALQKQLANTRAYTDEWYEVKQMVIEVDEAIADETVNAVENINKQIEAVEALTKAKNDYLSGSISTNDWLESLTDEDDYYNEDGSFSDKGLAVVKSKLNNISLYEQQAKNSQDNLNNLDKKLANGEITEAKYETKRLEYINDLQDATKSMYDEQQSLHDMYINGLKEESEALQELIDKKMESLKADKAEYDYQKSIAEKTKNITDLEKQLAMLEGDNSEEARAKRQKVKVELEEAQQDLEDTQYDKYLERLENSLGDLQDRFDAVIEKLDKQGALPSIEELKQLTDSNAASVTAGVEQIIKEAGLDQLLGEKGIGYLNPTTAELLTTPSTEISGKITTTNEWLEDIYTALSDGSSGTTEEDIVSIAEALGTYDSKNKTADTSGKSALNKYIMSQGYSAMDEEQMVTLKDAILNSKYSEGMDEGLRETLANIASADNLKKDKDANSSNNKNAILKAYKYTKANEFISKNATKATKKQSEYGILNKKIYDITGGKVLSKEDTLGLGNIFNVKDTDKSGGINADEAKKLVKLLENAGFANGGIVEAVRKNGDDGLATLKVGEAVLTPVQTTAFTELAKNIVPFNNLIGDIVERPNIPTVDRGAGTMTNNTIESVNFEFTLPNVTDKESLLNMIRNDKEVQRAFQNSTVGLLMSGNKQFNSRRL